MSLSAESFESTEAENLVSPSPYQIYEVRSFGPVDLSCWVAIPPEQNLSLPPLVAIHGIFRDAEGLLNAMATRVAQTGRVVIAPFFDEVSWLGYQRVLGKRRADLGLLCLLRTIQLNGIVNTEAIELFGYSGGAQFAHRFAMLYPHLIHRLALCSAGWYTFPQDAPYPYGLSVPEGGMPGFTALTRANLARFLRLPIDVYVGERDTESDRNTRRGDYIDSQQGRHRMERAANWVNALTRAAAAHGLQPNVTLTVLKGCGHDFRECVRKGKLVERLFPQLKAARPVSNHPAN
jgi:pimeloyl-ACP methyl ester carboxylesterase